MHKNIIKDKLPGVHFGPDGKAEILLWAPRCQNVVLLLQDRREQLPLEPLMHGYWSLITDKVKPGERYYFLLDGELERPDPASLAQPDGVHQPSLAVDLQRFAWTDAQWQNQPLEAYIIYELHTGTFTPEGTFAAIETKLDYLLELGINAIELMPVAQFPGDRNWGYDGVFPYAVQNSYGGAGGLMHLVNACHQKGIAVVLDVVYNHIGPEGNYFNDFGPYFTDKHHTPWGNAINFDDADSEAVRNYFIQNALMWFRDFHIDALRLDAVHAIKDDSEIHLLRKLKQSTDELVTGLGNPHYLMIEMDLNDPRYIDPAEKDGYGMHAQWVDEFHHALRVTAGGDRSGYYEDFEGIVHLAKAYNDAYVYDGQYSVHRKKDFGIKAADSLGKQFIVFSQNHDQVGNRMLGERSSQLFSFEMQKLMAGAVLISPYLPMLFMGEEWSEPNPFQYFVSHGDPDLVEAVRKGRREEFKHFHAEGEATDPQSEATFERSKLSWHLIDEPNHGKMLDYYKTLIALRKQLPSLYQLNRKLLKTTVMEDQQLLIVQRWSSREQVCCILNFSNQSHRVSLPPTVIWRKVLDSAASQWRVDGAPDSATAEHGVCLVQPESIIILTDYV